MRTGTRLIRCNGLVSRRSFLQVGALGLGGLSLADLLRLRSEAGQPTRDTAVIYIFLDGGPPHTDMYDLKPDAPVDYRGPFRATHTNVPGIEICDCMPRQARHMDKLSVMRTITHNTSDHIAGTAWMLTGYYGPTYEQPVAKYPSVGSIVAKVREDRSPDLPPYVAITNGDRGYNGAAYLGGAYNPFRINHDPNSPSFTVENLRLSSQLTVERIGDRQNLLKSLDRMRRDSDVRGTAEAIDKFQGKAFDLITGPRAQAAFDLSQESDKTRDRYGRHTWAQRLLLARRLVEAGVSFVTVAMNTPQGGWDVHENMEPRLKEMMPTYDQALAALIEDLADRGLYDKVTVCVAGEFGRGPRITTGGGRDHWGQAGFALLGGGGLKTGQVIGSTTARGEEPKDRPLRPEDLLATVYRVLGIDTRINFKDTLGRPHPILHGGKPIEELVG